MDHTNRAYLDYIKKQLAVMRREGLKHSDLADDVDRQLK